ncbi:choline dehydrogenase-like flavoprotein [Azospirillum sp. OGB3]|uniref:GMC family oxidoreductase n=1 Tax=Azospirillum sp. OGB3 TaxID=2587012 RepID=UPI00160606BC|nr:GMC family oxidoreductase [Azospirillum sp. OGB3]MBB3265170.1 choline dehydrogenase-like flavoprotein [Azospirillum sp. OGB3]
MNKDAAFDAVIVGAGVAGALIAKRLTDAGLTVLVLEAGPGTSRGLDDYTRHLERFYAASAKSPESPWPPAVGAPQPDTTALRNNDGYFVQRGPNPYGSSYTRLWGGSTLHWLGVSLRMLPEDFRMRSLHGVGRDWPLDYTALAPYYERAERAIGVSADVADQSYLGVTFPDGYDYPMRRVPPSYADRVLGAAVDGMPITLGDEEFAIRVRSYPAARNSIPRGDYRPAGAVDIRAGDGSSIPPLQGERCQGNTSCTPICPVQAKYHAGKTLAQADLRFLTVRVQAVASKILVDPASGAVQGIEYKRYDDPEAASHTTRVATGRTYILAAHAVENAKLMLASGLEGPRGHVGRTLMDHPALYAWGLAPLDVGAYRGPQSTSGIEELRGGAFRARHAAFRFDVGNDGWRASTGAPDTAVSDAVMTRNLFGPALRAQLGATLPRHVRLSLAVEQLPDPDNRVSIDPGYLDPLGNPRPVIDYRIDDYTLAGMAAASDVARAVFRRAGVTDCTDPSKGSWFPSVFYRGREFHYHGMGHFAGTHAMGADPAGSVVDADQRAWEHRNLFLVGSGSFPTMGTSNPTLTLAALALRTADRLVESLLP